MTIVPNRSALAALHFQNDICLKGGRMAPEDPAALERFAEATARTAALAHAARAAGMPVIHVAFGRPAGGAFANRHGRLFRWITEVGGCVEGSDGHAFIPALQPQTGDIVVGGPGTSGFTGSTFAPELARLGAATLILAGITTHWAVESTAREAAERGHEVVVVSDGVASANPATHDGALERLGFIARLESAQALIDALS